MLPADYAELLASIKADVGRTQVRAALAANRELLALYWRIGREIVARQAGATWGTAVLERLAADLRSAFPGVTGFSRANLFRVRAFYLAWPDPHHLSRRLRDKWSPRLGDRRRVTWKAMWQRRLHLRFQNPLRVCLGTTTWCSCSA